MIDAPSSEVKRWHGEPINKDLQTLYDFRSVISVPLSGESVHGRLFLLDKFSLTSDDLILAEGVGSHVAASVDLFYFLQRLQHVAAVAERMRLSRDLHDGVLQSLTVGGLRLKAAMDVLESNPEAARDQLRGIQDLIVQEQRDIRSFIESLRLATLVTGETDFKLAPVLDELVTTVERQWSLRVELRTNRVEERVPATLAREIYHLVREGLVNAARHSNASTARVELEIDDDQLLITISDDGHGFPFRGTYDHATLASKGFGPAMLKTRVASLGGLLRIDSSESGARLQITLPLARQET
jgi:signal transduction histidine kinase